jgi:L-aminopeptidase/D-esterase-like protein
LLEPEMTRAEVDAIVLSGGSAFGLDAAGGVQAMLRAQGRGLRVRDVVVPIVPQAILFDLLNGGDKDWGVFSPYRELGYQAAMEAGGGDFALGSVGAGTGASTATMKGGLGSASAVSASGHVVGAIAAVNAVGTATIGHGPHFWAAPFEVGDEFGGLGWPARMPPDALRLRIKGGPVDATPATTICIVATNAVLTKAEAKRVAIMANDGLARAILPAHAPTDGDCVFAAATGRKKLTGPHDLTAIGHTAGLVLARAIARGVYEATALPYAGAMRSWEDLFAPPRNG